MRLKPDENLPVDLVAPLARLGHDADTIFQEKLTGQDDATVWEAAQEAGRFLVSQDLGFSDIRSHAPGTQLKTDEEAFAEGGVWRFHQEVCKRTQATTSPFFSRATPSINSIPS